MDQESLQTEVNMAEVKIGVIDDVIKSPDIMKTLTSQISSMDVINGFKERLEPESSGDEK